METMVNAGSVTFKMMLLIPRVVVLSKIFNLRAIKPANNNKNKTRTFPSTTDGFTIIFLYFFMKLIKAQYALKRFLCKYETFFVYL